MRPILLLTAILTTALAGHAAAEVKVVATVPDLAAIAKQLGGAKVSVTAMSLASQDPHFVDAKPSLVLKLNKADVLLAIGVQLEVGWLPALQTQARNSRILTSGSGYLECAPSVALLDAGKRVDRAHGDVHPGGNPHFLYDPRAAAACANAIAERLAKVDPANAKLYRANLAKFLRDLDVARAGWEQRLAPYKGAPVITYHASLGYLAAWVGLREIATLEPKPGIPPTARHVAEVIKLGKQEGVRAVLQEAYYPDKTCALVAGKLGVKVVRIPGGADVAAGQTYIARMDQVIAGLITALGPR